MMDSTHVHYSCFPLSIVGNFAVVVGCLEASQGWSEDEESFDERTAAAEVGGQGGRRISISAFPLAIECCSRHEISSLQLQHLPGERTDDGKKKTMIFVPHGPDI